MSVPEIQLFYKKIFNELAEQIASGRFKPGDLLPSEKALCDQYKVSRITTKKALDLLVEQGLIARFPGKGSFVKGQTEKIDALAPSIGLILSDFSDSFGARLIYGIEDACLTLGYNLILKRTKDDLGAETAAINSLINGDVRGILMQPVHGEHYNSEILKLVLNKKPLVFVDRRMKGLAVPAVSADNIAAAAEGTTYLLRRGHRNIGFFSGPIKYTSTVEDRRQGFIKAFLDCNIKYNSAFFCHDLASPYSYPFYPHKRVEKNLTSVMNHLSSYPEITAAFVTEYNLALVVRLAAERMDRKVPKDLSILCFDAPPVFNSSPLFTFIDQDEYAIGKTAVETLHGLIAGDNSKLEENIIIPAKLIEGASVVPLKNGLAKKA
jgi:DNA-binding LacI/PurR family transcriptional regulator